MIPIKNKKKNLKVTVEEMRNFSFNYIEKYAPSKQQLRTYLLKKYIKSKIPNTNKKNLTDLIDVVLEDLEKSRFINDEFSFKQNYEIDYLSIFLRIIKFTIGNHFAEPSSIIHC